VPNTRSADCNRQKRKDESDETYSYVCALQDQITGGNAG
jgi:hypothetical protein